jgi:hypothetical protein
MTTDTNKPVIKLETGVISELLTVDNSLGYVGRTQPVSPAAIVNFSVIMAQQLPEGMLRKEQSVKPVPEPVGVGRLLDDLSKYMMGRRQAMVNMMDEAVRTGSPDKMLKVGAALIDGSTEATLIAKTIGKTVSAVDQLTKLN